MTAPKTNVEKESRRHRPALIGIAVAVALGAGFFLLNLGSAVDDEGVLIENPDDENLPAFTGDPSDAPDATD